GKPPRNAVCSADARESRTASAVCGGTSATRIVPESSAPGFTCWAASPSREVSSDASRRVRIAPKMAAPNIEPIVRENWMEAVAMPSEERGTEFCIATTYVWNICPMPDPISTMQRIACHREEWELNPLSTAKPTRVVIDPEIGQMRYRPVRVTV